MINKLNLIRIGLISILTIAIMPGSDSMASAKELDTNKPGVLKDYGSLPMRFEANVGQTDARIKFISRGSGYTMFLTSDEAVLVLNKPIETEVLPMMGEEPHKANEVMVDIDAPEVETAVLRMKLLGADSAPVVTGLKELPGIANYFVGNDPQKWNTNVPSYAKVEYKEVYEGVDLVYYGNQRQLEFDFVVAAGANPNVIKLDFEGAERLEIDEEGDLVIHVSGGELRQHKPIIYQEIDGNREAVAGGYVLQGERQVSFEVADYNHDRPLVIDPILSYSTYLGGSSVDESWRIAVDGSGNAYITGFTRSINFPTANALQISRGGGIDVFVTKINSSGSALVYSTYLGGSWDDFGWSIAVDDSGNAYVAGYTESLNFPNANALQPIKSGGVDVFVTKINSLGSALVYSTYLGGNSYDYGRGITVDGSGNAYVTGATGSSNFPTANALYSSYGGWDDVFVTKINSSGSTLVYSTYLGGSSTEYSHDIAVDGLGNAYVIGYTVSDNFPMVNALQSFRGGSRDAFVTKINSLGSALVYSTYLGGSSNEFGYGIAVDSSGNAYVTGSTHSLNFPTANAFQSSRDIFVDAFVAKINSSGSALVYSTYLGGGSGDFGWGIAVNDSGNAYVTGYTGSWDFPTANAYQSNKVNMRDVFVTKLDTSGSALVYSTYLGGGDDDWGRGIAVDGSGNAYVTGFTSSWDFPTANAYQSSNSNNGNSDAFIAKIDFNPNRPPVADAGQNQQVFVLEIAQLDGSGSNDPDGDPLTYSWSITSKPAGSAAALSDPSAVAPTFQPDAAGDYIIQLVVNDGIISSDPIEVTITAPNRLPVADAGQNQQVFVLEIAQLDGSGSSDPDGDPLTYSWSITSKPAGSIAALSDPSLVGPTFEADKAGDYIIQLVVNDGIVSSDPKEITITALVFNPNQPPVADAGQGQQVIVLEIVQLDGSGSSDPDGDPLTYSWSITSKPAGSATALSDPSVVSPTFGPDAAGDYIIQLVVNDGIVSSDPIEVTITALVSISSQLPVANAGPDQLLEWTGPLGTPAQLDGSGSTNPGGGPLTYTWTGPFPESGSTVTGVNPTVTIALGTSTIRLVVNDGSVFSDPDQVGITVEDEDALLRENAFTYALFGVKKKIKIDKNTTIYGNVFNGDDVEVKKDATITGCIHTTGTVNGDGSYTVCTLPDPLPLFPTFDTSPYDAWLTAAGDQPEEDHEYDQLDLNGGVLLVNGDVEIEDGGTITGPGTLVATGEIEIEEDGYIDEGLVLIAGEELKIGKRTISPLDVDVYNIYFSADDIKIEENAEISGALISADKVEFKKHTVFKGIVFTTGEVKIKKESDITGSVVGNKIKKVSKDATVTYDGAVVQSISTNPGAVPEGIPSKRTNAPLAEDVRSLPESFVLEQNYPNPFNPVTTIRYVLPEPGDVTLVIYNLNGEEVTRLVHSQQQAGYYQVAWNATNVASGIYFYRLQAGSYVETRKMILLR